MTPQERSESDSSGLKPGAEPLGAVTHPIALSYGSDGSRRRRRIIRWVVALVMALGLTFAGWRYGPHAWLFARQYYWERRCMNFEASPDVAVYERLPHGSARPAIITPYLDGNSREVLALGPAVSSPRLPPTKPDVEIYRVPACLVRFMQVSGQGKLNGLASAIVFCHERISPAGHRRLVTVEYPKEFGFTVD